MNATSGESSIADAHFVRESMMKMYTDTPPSLPFSRSVPSLPKDVSLDPLLLLLSSQYI